MAQDIVENVVDIHAAVEDIKHKLNEQNTLALETRIAIEKKIEDTRQDGENIKSIVNSHIREEYLRTNRILSRVNILIALAMSGWLVGMVGSHGLGQLIAFVKGSDLGVEGVIALVGVVILILTPLGNMIFLRASSKDNGGV